MFKELWSIQNKVFDNFNENDENTDEEIYEE